MRVKEYEFSFIVIGHEKMQNLASILPDYVDDYLCRERKPGEGSAPVAPPILKQQRRGPRDPETIAYRKAHAGYYEKEGRGRNVMLALVARVRELGRPAVFRTDFAGVIEAHAYKPGSLSPLLGIAVELRFLRRIKKGTYDLP